MTRKYLIPTVVVLSIGLTAASVMAKPRGVDFSALDSDGNGELTLEEMQQSADVRFREVDTDGNGTLSAEEIAAHARANAEDRAARMIERMDRDGDGTLSRDEMRGRRDPARMFARIDADDSGTISQEEFDNARERMRDRRMKRRGDH